MNRFPILRLPYVALREVILSTDKSDVTNLALSSKKACRIINTTRNAVSMQKLSLEVVNGLGAIDRLNIAHLESLENSRDVTKIMKLKISDQLSIDFLMFYLGDDPQRHIVSFQFKFYPVNDKIEGKQEIMRFGELDVPVVIKSKDTIRTIWEDLEYGFQFLSHHFLLKFNLKKINLKVNPKGAEFSKFLKNSSDFVKSSMKEKPSLSIKNIELMTDSDLKTVLQNIDYALIDVMGSGTFPENFSCEAFQLLISNADGFTLKNLLNSKCYIVYLSGTQMTSKDMKEVLSKWMDGRLERLGYLHVELIENMDIEMILTGLSDRTGYDLDRTEESVKIRRRDGNKVEILIPKDEEKRKIFDMRFSN